MRIRTRYAAIAACLLVSTAIVGCDDGRTRSPAVAVRLMHAAPELATLNILREQRSETQLEYRQTSSRLLFDADQYDFNVWELDPNGNATTAVGSFSHDLVAGNDYFIAVAEAGGVLTPIVVERPAFDGSATEVQAAHAAPTLGALSVYIEPDGTLPSAGTPLGTVSFGEALEPASRASGEYRLFLTEPGVPANTLFASPTFTLEEGQAYTYAILGPTDDSIAPIAVASVSLDSTLLFDEGTQSVFYAVNAVADGEPRDIYIDDDFSAPVIAALPHAARSGATPIPSGSRELKVTPAGNPAAIEAENTNTYARSRHHIVLIGGEPGNVSAIAAVAERRRLAGRARIMFMNGATQLAPLDVFLAPPGTDISDLTSALTLNVPGMSTRLAVPPGSYEISLRDSETDVIVAGPAEITLEGGGVYSVLAVNGAAAGTADLVYYEDFVQ